MIVLALGLSVASLSLTWVLWQIAMSIFGVINLFVLIMLGVLFALSFTTVVWFLVHVAEYHIKHNTSIVLKLQEAVTESTSDTISELITASEVAQKDYMNKDYWNGYADFAKDLDRALTIKNTKVGK